MQIYIDMKQTIKWSRKTKKNEMKRNETTTERLMERKIERRRKKEPKIALKSHGIVNK